MSMLTLAAALEETRAALAVFGEDAAREAQHLVISSLDISPIFIHTNPQYPIDPIALERLRLWTRRRAAGEPLAYLTGKREFWSLEFAVSPAVLIPRPETEGLVERVLNHGDNRDDHLSGSTHRQIRVADLGTGSGIIAISVAHERPHWRCTAVDISADALELAKANARRLTPGRVDLRKGSWFEPLATERYDVIASNPPYVDALDPVLQGDSLAFEPRLALTPGNDALVALHHIIDHAPAYLYPAGWLCLEHGADQGPAVRQRLVAQGYAHVVSHRDLAGHERVTEGQWLPTGDPTLG